MTLEAIPPHLHRRRARGRRGARRCRWLRGRTRRRAAFARRALDADAEALFAAVAPVLLAGALPESGEARRAALRETLDGIDIAVAGLPPARASRACDSCSRCSRCRRCGSASRASRARGTRRRPTRSARFLDRCRDSSSALLRAAYDALHQLTFAAWYGNPKSWPAIGYPGPPRSDDAWPSRSCRPDRSRIARRAGSRRRLARSSAISRSKPTS